MEHILGLTESHWMLPPGECMRRIAPADAMVIKFGVKYKTLTKNCF
jgi:hypothetical protein